MLISCAMMSSKVTPPIEEEGVDVDGVVEAGGIAIPGHLERSCASLHLTVVAFMAHMT